MFDMIIGLFSIPIAERYKNIEVKLPKQISDLFSFVFPFFGLEIHEYLLTFDAYSAERRSFFLL